MPCYRPLEAWYNPTKHPSTDSKITFSKHFSEAKGIHLPCGQCIGCRLERSRRWAVRIMHEAQMHERSSFLTLTYSDKHIPEDKSLRVEDFQKFMKRLRRGSSVPLRFFHCGEYGERSARPHYHVCLFGEDFYADRKRISDSQSGFPQYISQRLCETWGLGEIHQQTIGELTFESAAYVARYCLKKVTGDGAAEHYAGRHPEYVTMSRRPGIGAGWFERFNGEVYPSDSVVMRGREFLPPPFYDKLLEKADPALFARVKSARSSEIISSVDMDYSQWQEAFGRRLSVKEEVKEQTISKTLKRGV